MTETNRKHVIVCFGPGPKFKGGIQNYNTSLALALDRFEGNEVHIVSWTQQYPAIIPREFVDKSSKSDLLQGSNVQVSYITNYNKPSTWRETVRYIQSIGAKTVIFQWSIALQGLPIGAMAKRLRSAGVDVVMDLHFVIQKEGSSIDAFLTRRGIRHASRYVVHAIKTYQELKTLFPQQSLKLIQDGQIKDGESNGTPVLKLFHPIYDLFKPDPNMDVEAFKRQHGLRKNVFLFFGFIRKYKGLHHTIEAFAKVAAQREDVSLLICGESFWNTLDESKWINRWKQRIFKWAKTLFLKKSDDERMYQPLQLIEQLHIQDRCVVFNRFIPNEEVHLYFQCSDAVVLYYLTATPSGIESLSYNFKLPILATRVGHFPETIQDGFNGYLANAGDVEDMARVMLRYLDAPLPSDHVVESTKSMSWDNYAKAIMEWFG